MKKPSLRVNVFDKTFYFDNTTLVKDKKSSYLGADASSGDTDFTVQSISGFDNTAKTLLIGEIGQEKTELANFSHATVPSGTTIYLNGSLTFDHPQDTKVYIADFDQVAFSRATAIGSEKGTLSTGLSIQVDQKETFYQDTTNTEGYGFAEFKDTIAGTYSTASDPVPYEGYDDDTVFMIKKRALDSSGEEVGDLISHQYLNECLWQARREYHKMPGKRPFRVVMDEPYTTASIGMWRVSVPSDLEDSSTAKNLYGVRVGDNKNLSYWNKKEMDNVWEGAVMSVVNTAYVTTSAYLQLADTRDLPSSGSVEVEQDAIEYSANDRSRSILDVSSAGSYDHNAGKESSYNKSSGLPQYYTVLKDADGTSYITFDCPIDRDYYDRNIWIDYYRTVVAYDSDADKLDEPEYDMFVPYLKWSIKDRKNKGSTKIDDPNYQLWMLKKDNALTNEHLGQEVKFIPDV